MPCRGLAFCILRFLKSLSFKFLPLPTLTLSCGSLSSTWFFIFPLATAGLGLVKYRHPFIYPASCPAICHSHACAYLIPVFELYYLLGDSGCIFTCLVIIFLFPSNRCCRINPTNLSTFPPLNDCFGRGQPAAPVLSFRPIRVAGPGGAEKHTFHSTTTMTLFELPSLLWARYIEYLWDYEPGSWVDASASTFRLVAAFIVMPLLLLVMLASPSLRTVLHVNHQTLITLSTLSSVLAF